MPSSGVSVSEVEVRALLEPFPGEGRVPPLSVGRDDVRVDPRVREREEEGYHRDWNPLSRHPLTRPRGPTDPTDSHSRRTRPGSDERWTRVGRTTTYRRKTDCRRNRPRSSVIYILARTFSSVVYGRLTKTNIPCFLLPHFLRTLQTPDLFVYGPTGK